MNSKRMSSCLKRFHVAQPKPRDKKERPTCIPQAVLEVRAKESTEEKRKLEKDFEEENGGAGVFSASLKKHYILADDEWKEDIMPEILDGHNVYDFVDVDILQRLEELEREEGLRLVADGEDVDDFEMDGSELTAEEKAALAEIRRKKSELIQKHRIKKSTAESRPIVPKKYDKDREFTSKQMGRQLSSLGIDPSAAIERIRRRSLSVKRGRERDRSNANVGEDMDVDGGDDAPKKKMMRATERSRSREMSRSRSRPPGEIVPGEGFKYSAQKLTALKIARKSVKLRNRDARRGEADRVIPNLKPKHLFSGKRSIGKTDSR